MLLLQKELYVDSSAPLASIFNGGAYFVMIRSFWKLGSIDQTFHLVS
jgi:hypothetical protein